MTEMEQLTKRIFDVTKTKVLSSEDIDLEKGYLIDTILETEHKAIEGIEEQGHYETVKEYPNGGKDVEWIVDVPGVNAQEAWIEQEPIQVYIKYTDTELESLERSKRIEALKQTLAGTDYKAIKYFEGYYTEEEYLPIKTYRESLREEIRKLENADLNKKQGEEI